MIEINPIEIKKVEYSDYIEKLCDVLEYQTLHKIIETDQVDYVYSENMTEEDKAKYKDAHKQFLKRKEVFIGENLFPFLGTAKNKFLLHEIVQLEVDQEVWWRAITQEEKNFIHILADMTFLSGGKVHIFINLGRFYPTIMQNSWISSKHRFITYMMKYLVEKYRAVFGEYNLNVEFIGEKLDYGIIENNIEPICTLRCSLPIFYLNFLQEIGDFIITKRAFQYDKKYYIPSNLIHNIAIGQNIDYYDETIEAIIIKENPIYTTSKEIFKSENTMSDCLITCFESDLRQLQQKINKKEVVVNQVIKDITNNVVEML